MATHGGMLLQLLLIYKESFITDDIFERLERLLPVGLSCTAEPTSGFLPVAKPDVCLGASGGLSSIIQKSSESATVRFAGAAASRGVGLLPLERSDLSTTSISSATSMSPSPGGGNAMGSGDGERPKRASVMRGGPLRAGGWKPSLLEPLTGCGEFRKGGGASKSFSKSS
mmetsp:Transcript_93500/g.237992  ORF Transcript_93500/g.237992 Transcript_93500/m.237992 type:complete len:170 (+) Transcript_93500:230-739(+)